MSDSKMSDELFQEISTFDSQFDSLPDGAYFAAMEEQGIDAATLADYSQEMERREEEEEQQENEE